MADSDGAALDDLPHALIKRKEPFDGENDGVLAVYGVFQQGC